MGSVKARVEGRFATAVSAMVDGKSGVFCRTSVDLKFEMNGSDGRRMEG